MNVYRCANRAGNHRWVVAPNPETAAEYMVASGRAKRPENVTVRDALHDPTDTYLHDPRPSMLLSLLPILSIPDVGHLIKVLGEPPVWALVEEVPEMNPHKSLTPEQEALIVLGAWIIRGMEVEG